MAANLLRMTLLGVLCLVLAGCGGSDDSPESADPTATPPSSTSPATNEQLVDVGGYSLAIECEGDGSPTVVFESGSGGDRHAVADWVDLPVDVRVCAYDRAGLGASEPRPADGATTLRALSDELVRLLQGAGITEPVVLASHSLGGGIHQFFADAYPDRVAGLVFIDPVAIPGFVDHYGPEIADGTGGTIDMKQTAQEWEALGDFGSIPMVVLTQGFVGEDASKEFRRYFRAAHDDLAARSTNSIHVIAEESGHMIHETVPELVVAAITEVIEAVGSGDQLAPCDERFEAVGGRCA